MEVLASGGSNSGLKINFTANVEQALQMLRDIDRWSIPYITAAALTDTAMSARKAEKKSMIGYFDRPTPYVTRGVLWEKATRDYLVSRVYLNDEAYKGNRVTDILSAEISGGPRHIKKYEKSLRGAGILNSNEFTVPGDSVPLNAQGNIGRANINQMLAQVKATSRVASGGRKTSRYFIARGDNKLARGIWERRGKKIRPFLIFVEGAPTYRKRYPFGEAAIQHAERNFARHWKRRFNSFVVKGKILKGSGSVG